MPTIPHYTPAWRGANALFAGADDGWYTLPAELLAHRTAVRTLTDEVAATVYPDLGAIEQEHVGALIAAARAGKRLPASTVLLDAQTAHAAATRRGNVLREAAQRADNQLGAALQDYSDQVITDHLAPVVVEIMAAITAASELLPADPTPETLLRASEQARQAWFTVGDSAARYERVRAAAAAVRRHSDQPQYDTRGDFAELHNYHEITKGMNIQINGPRPWPTGTAERLLWHVRNGGKVWLPTLAQMDARYYEVHKDAIEQQKQRGLAVQGARNAFG